MIEQDFEEKRPSNSGYWFYDLRENRFTVVSQMLADIYGLDEKYSKLNDYPETQKNLFYHRDRNLIERKRLRLLSLMEGEKIYFVYRGINQKDGKILFLKDEAWAVYEEGSIVGAAGWTWKITREEFHKSKED